ncbi:MAG TPA: hypothetical protein VKB03_16120 [Conexibacter sp.]|nr:hypothetical protein [Conexibacter sp.]
MFAAHCFKRVQNRQLDALIRAKMIGDLGKAIALKSADVWPVDAWTFLSNYPISETLGAEVSTIGREAAIDVAWRGPDYFASALTRHSEVAAAFPDLQINNLAAQLSEIQRALSDDRASTDEPLRVGLPRTPSEQDALLRERPPVWEFLLFAGVLLQRRAALEPKWRGHELRLPSRSRQYLDEDAVAPHLSKAASRLRQTVEPMKRIFEDQQAAFGAPGEHGDAVRIIHFAEWLMNAYEDLLDWAAELRAAIVPDEFQRAVELNAQAADQPLQRLRGFVDDVIRGAEKIPEHLATPEAEREPLVIDPTLHMALDGDVTDRAVAELRRALGLT